MNPLIQSLLEILISLCVIVVCILSFVAFVSAIEEKVRTKFRRNKMFTPFDESEPFHEAPKAKPIQLSDLNRRARRAAKIGLAVNKKKTTELNEMRKQIQEGKKILSYKDLQNRVFNGK